MPLHRMVLYPPTTNASGLCGLFQQAPGNHLRLADVIYFASMIGLPEVFRSASEYRMVAVGAFMVLMMIFKPEGLFGKKLFQTTYKV